ncbi:MAG TPA: hypothetical protein VK327_03370 [Candidatus Paceibacterota bacterium]|nr:hypothetical protein [Candidatus Paceibacterota bacterium]
MTRKREAVSEPARIAGDAITTNSRAGFSPGKSLADARALAEMTAHVINAKNFAE